MVTSTMKIGVISDEAYSANDMHAVSKKDSTKEERGTEPAGKAGGQKCESTVAK